MWRSWFPSRDHFHWECSQWPIQLDIKTNHLLISRILLLRDEKVMESEIIDSDHQDEVG